MRRSPRVPPRPLVPFIRSYHIAPASDRQYFFIPEPILIGHPWSAGPVGQTGRCDTLEGREEAAFMD